MHQRKLSKRVALGTRSNLFPERVVCFAAFSFDVDLEGTVLDDVKVITGSSLFDDDLTGTDRDLFHRSEDIRLLLLVEISEQKVGFDGCADSSQLLVGFGERWRVVVWVGRRFVFFGGRFETGRERSLIGRDE